MDPLAAETLAGALAVLAERCRGVPLPPPDLDGWSSLCAGEYRDAVALLAASVHRATAAAQDAARLLRTA